MNAAMETPTATKSSDKPDWAMNKREADRADRLARGLPIKRRRWPWIVGVGLIVLVGGYFIYAGQRADVPVVETVAAEPLMQVNGDEIGVVQPSLLEQSVKVTGTLMPGREAQLSSQVSGRVDQVNFRAGDMVLRGDVLVQVDVQNLSIQLSQQRSSADATRAQLNLAQSQLDRAVSLSERGLSSESALEQNRSNVDALKANLAAQEGQIKTAEIALSNATIKAEFDGVVASRSVEPGQVISAGTPLITIVDPSDMEMQAMAPIGAGARLQENQRVAVTVDGIPNREFLGVVVRISPVALEGTRSLPLYINIDNIEGLMRGGMFATGQVVVAEQKDGVAVPATALREDADGQYVLKISDGALVHQRVEIGQEWSGGRLIGITDGLRSGDTIVTAPLPELAAGDKVQIVGN